MLHTVHDLAQQRDESELDLLFSIHLVTFNDALPFSEVIVRRG